MNTESHLCAASTRLENAGGISIEQATRHMRALKAFLAACSAVGCETEFLAAAEQARLGDMAEALLTLVRR